MSRALTGIGRLILFLLSPIVLFVTAACIAIADVAFLLLGQRRSRSVPGAPQRGAVSIVIPNWNGRDLLEKYLPGVVSAAARIKGSEIIVVDNASEDGSSELLAASFPSVRILRQTVNLGFGGGSNAGFAAAANDIVVLLNSDMRVDQDFLAPLVEAFHDPDVFAVACQIFFPDPARRREETGLTQGSWSNGRFLIRHRIDDEVRSAFPCFYPGGGSSAFDRRKFVELGGFDEVLKPFYYEDTDLGYMAWKRGWKVLYEPRSIVFHEHCGTIGKKFSPAYINRILKKNVLLMTWKNVHDWRMLTAHFCACFVSATGGLVRTGDANCFTFDGLYRAFLQLRQLLQSRWRAKSLAVVSDCEALRRPLGGYFRDRFEAPGEPLPERLKVLFVAPYPIEPPVHGGAVFMKQTLEELGRLADVHLAGFLENDSEFQAQEALRSFVRSMYFQLRLPLFHRNPASLTPHGVREFYDADFDWALHRILFTQKIDVLQLEYTVLGQYAGNYRHIPCMLFEHDVFFQTIGRQLSNPHAPATGRKRLLEYLRVLHYEPRMLGRMTRIQMCSDSNRDYLLGFAPRLAAKLDTNLRAGIRVSDYVFQEDFRQPDTLLFVGSFRHGPNQEALNWFVKEVLPTVVKVRPQVKLVVVGSDPPPLLAHLLENPNVELTGFVPDIREPLRKFAVFVCPILSGSGIRVKLLEAFAAGVPVVSTRVGAEGLAERSGETCEMGDTPEGFAQGALRLLADPAYAKQIARSARRYVEVRHDVEPMTRKLEAVYRREVSSRRSLAAAENAIRPVGASAP